MSRLYIFELKKLFQKKALWVVLVIGLIVNTVVISTNVLFDSYSYPDGTSISGADYYKHENKVCSQLSGRVVDDVFINEVRDEVIDFAYDKNYVTDKSIEELKSGNAPVGYQYKGEESQTWDNAMVGLNYAAEELGLGDAWYFLEEAVDDNSLLLTVSGEEFQQAIRDNIAFPEQNTEYWKAEAKDIQNPVVYNYVEPLIPLLDVGFVNGWIIFLLIAVSLSGVFADECSTRMDALIISSKNGRMPIAIAKILACMTIAIASSAVVTACAILTSRITRGELRMDAIIQMYIPDCAQNLTMGDVVCKLIVCTLIMSMLYAAVTVFLSEIMNSTAVMAIQAGILIGGLFNIPFKQQLLIDLWNIRPTTFLQGWLENYSTFKFGTATLDCVQMAELLYVIAAMIFIALTLILYRKYQVKSR